MALEEETIMMHRLNSEKIQMITGVLASGAFKNENNYSQIEDMLTKIVLTYGEQTESTTILG